MQLGKNKEKNIFTWFELRVRFETAIVIWIDWKGKVNLIPCFCCFFLRCLFPISTFIFTFIILIQEVVTVFSQTVIMKGIPAVTSYFFLCIVCHESFAKDSK